MDFDDFMRSTNGPAYEKNEARNGPPLSYVGEKIRYALENCHDLLQGIESCVPNNLPLPDGYQEGASLSAKLDFLKSPALASFHYQVTAFAALFNMLGMVKSSKDIERLAQTPEKDFKKWLDFVEREGSVLG